MSKVIPLKLLKPIGELAKALNAKELTKRLAEVDMTKLQKGNETEKAEEATKLGMILIELILSNLDTVADPFCRLVAAYKGFSFEEAQELDIVETVKSLLSDAGVMSFLS